MKKIIIAAIIVFATLSATAQTFKIQKAWAFITQSMPGMAMADENGNTIPPQPIVERFVYVETNYKGALKIDTIVLNGVLYKPAVTAVAAVKHQAGNMFTDNKPIYITPKKGNKLWRVDLQAVNTPAPEYGKLKKLTVKGKLGSTLFTQFFTQEQRLAGPEYN